MQKVYNLIEKIKNTEATVLIHGESGTGKELIAQAIHGNSQRCYMPFIAVSCGALPDSLLESELFGYEKGAFTGADYTKKGRFEMADKGTLFLDEIGEMSLPLQAKLLRAVETGEIIPLGATKVEKVNVRFLAATNKELFKEVEQGNFREDLYYRLHIIPVTLPPLRERKEDIEQFINVFIESFCRQNKIKRAAINPESLDLLRSYQWPGNVRELKNIIETMIVLSHGKEITPQMVREHLVIFIPREEETGTFLPVVTNKSVEQAERELIYRAIVSMGVELTEIKKFLASSMQHMDRKIDLLAGNTQSFFEDDSEDIVGLDELERRAIINALKKFRGNRKKIAEKLNISERTLYRKIKDYDLENE
ncbi:MAG: sigma-54-dependent Fis family transcriptional regulator [Calditrichia bacterium]|nr:sigma-54-dependent Fis family transcriptional regulator [Calditrichia bacterium]